MKKHIKIEIDKLFEEMKTEVKKVGLKKQFQKGVKTDLWYSETIGDFRIKALQMVRDVNFLGSHDERMQFMRGFGRKTTPYFWCKKELF